MFDKKYICTRTRKVAKKMETKNFTFRYNAPSTMEEMKVSISEKTMCVDGRHQYSHKAKPFIMNLVKKFFKDDVECAKIIFNGRTIANSDIVVQPTNERTILIDVYNDNGDIETEFIFGQNGSLVFTTMEGDNKPTSVAEVFRMLVDELFEE